MWKLNTATFNSSEQDFISVFSFFQASHFSIMSTGTMRHSFAHNISIPRFQQCLCISLVEVAYPLQGILMLLSLLSNLHSTGVHYSWEAHQYSLQCTKLTDVHDNFFFLISLQIILNIHQLGYHVPCGVKFSWFLRMGGKQYAATAYYSS